LRRGERGVATSGAAPPTSTETISFQLSSYEEAENKSVGKDTSGAGYEAGEKSCEKK
jgi:hypothetical protein